MTIVSLRRDSTIEKQIKIHRQSTPYVHLAHFTSLFFGCVTVHVEHSPSDDRVHVFDPSAHKPVHARLLCRNVMLVIVHIKYYEAY